LNSTSKKSLREIVNFKEPKSALTGGGKGSRGKRFLERVQKCTLGIAGYGKVRVDDDFIWSEG
jgi:hypothetical protein